MKITLIEKPSVIMSNPNSRHNFFAWPSVARLKNGKIAVAASGFRLKHVCPFGKAVISYSEDEGNSYTAPAPIIDTPLDDRDAGLLAFGESGVMITSFNNTVSFQHSCTKEPSYFNTCNDPYVNAYLDSISAEDEAKYLGSTFRISHDNGITFGEIMKSPITSPHGPLEMKNGNILWVGRIFANDNDVEKGDIRAYLITNDGKNEFVGSIENIYDDGEIILSCEPHAIELVDGKIICHIRVQRYEKSKIFTIYQSESEDGGKTWTKPHQILTDLGGAPAHLLKHSSGMLISVYGDREAPYGIKAMFSRNGGKTWDTDNLIYNNNNICGDLGYPASVELNDGSILTVFYAHPTPDSSAVIIQQKWKFEE